MFEDIENLKITSSLHRTSKAFSVVKNRSVNAFIIRVTGSVAYNFSDKILTVNEGDMIFIPKGASYEYKTVSDTDSMYTSINFQADFTEPKPTVFSLENFFEAEYLSNHFSDLWKFGTPAEKYKCMSLFYSLLSYISGVESASYSDKKKYKLIEPAVTYLKKHMYECSLKCDMLHRLCGISGTYFRKIFLARFGTTPQNYIMSKRLSHAKSIMDSGDFDSIREVALSVGYNDPLYFSKAFKKIYGVSPSEIK